MLLEMLANSTNEIEIKDTLFSKKEIILGIAINFLVVFFSLSGIIMQVFSAFNGESGFQIFTYFTTISNIMICLVCLAMMILEVLRLFTGNDYRNSFVYRLKFTATIGISITLIIYTIFIMPAMINAYGLKGVFEKPDNLLIHFVVPIVAIIDFFLFDYNYKSKRTDVYYPVIYLYIYFFIVLIMSLLGYKWKAMGSLGGSSVMPYSFINYELNEWFSFDLANANLSIGKTGIGVFYMILFITIFVIILSLLFLRIKNKIQRKKYNIVLLQESYHCDK